MQLVTQVEKANFLTWTGLRHTIHFILKTIDYTNFKENTYFIKGNAKISAEKKTNDYYNTL